MKVVLTTALFLLCLSFISCQRCKDCTLTRTFEVEGVGEQTTTTIREYCGSTLDDIEENSSYNKDDVEYKWVCE